MSVQRRDFSLKTFSNWKETEYKNFFVYLTIPILNEHLEKESIFNLYCLVLGTGNVSNVVMRAIGTFLSQLKVCHNKMKIFYLFLVQEYTNL